MDEDTANLAKIFKALADGSRLRILLSVHQEECRCEGSQPPCQNETCIKDISGSLNISVPTVSHHVRELVNAGLIVTRKEGRWVHCRVNREAFDRACGFLGSFFGRQPFVLMGRQNPQGPRGQRRTTEQGR